MCLCIVKSQTAKIKKLLKEKKQLSVYKWLNRTSDGQGLVSYGLFKWQPGENVSDRQAVALTKDESESGCVDHGFHVCLEKPNSEYLRIRQIKYLRMVGKLEDFIAAGQGEAVFRKLTLPQGEYNKALGIKKEAPAKKKTPVQVVKKAVKNVKKAPVKKAPVKKAVKKK